MVILRRTNRLKNHLLATPDAHATSDTALGDWYVNRLVVQRRPLLLLISSATLLPLVLPARDIRTLPERLPALVDQRLARLGVATHVIQAEVEMMSPVIVQKTADRAVLGIMVDFAKAIPHYLAPGNNDLTVVEDHLEETPCFSGRGFPNVIFPHDKTLQLLRQRWSAA